MTANQAIPNQLLTIPNCYLYFLLLFQCGDHPYGEQPADQLGHEDVLRVEGWPGQGPQYGPQWGARPDRVRLLWQDGNTHTGGNMLWIGVVSEIINSGKKSFMKDLSVIRLSVGLTVTCLLQNISRNWASFTMEILNITKLLLLWQKDYNVLFIVEWSKSYCHKAISNFTLWSVFMETKPHMKINGDTLTLIIAMLNGLSDLCVRQGHIMCIYPWSVSEHHGVQEGISEREVLRWLSGQGG